MPMEDGDRFVSMSMAIHSHRDNCYMYPGSDGGNYYAAAQGIVIRRNDGHQLCCEMRRRLER